ncbi:hypothetical protein PG5_01720 [Pseudomonas sp. G5(2012)]|nr:hypothetical protein PG5_01720 [Pseudomonas sp. G5(2012)]
MPFKQLHIGMGLALCASIVAMVLARFTTMSLRCFIMEIEVKV